RSASPARASSGPHRSGGPFSGHAALQCPHHGDGCAVGRLASADFAGRDIPVTRCGQPAESRGHAGIDRRFGGGLRGSCAGSGPRSRPPVRLARKAHSQQGQDAPFRHACVYPQSRSRLRNHVAHPSLGKRAAVDRALNLGDTSTAAALKNQGNAHKAAGNPALAIESYRRSLQIDPDYLPSLYNLGLALHETESFKEAEACFRRVLAIEPCDVDALFHLGVLLQRCMRLEEAANAFRLAVRHAPDNPYHWMRLGDVGIKLLTDHSLREAAECFRKALALQPDSAIANFNLGCVHRLEGRHDEALRSFQAALTLEPDTVAFAASVLDEKLQLCEWSHLDGLCESRRRSALEHPEQPVQPFGLLAIPSTPMEQLACARNLARLLAGSIASERKQLSFRFDRPSRERRRVGYLSAEFHAHATAYLAAELFELHDRSRYEIFAYSYGPEDGSAIRARLQRGFDRFVDVRSLSHAEAAAAIHADGVDILVDLKGYTVHARPEIMALRPAPVQVNYLGYPGTMGADFIDYIVGDRFITPAARAGEFSENLVIMPDSYQVNDRRRQVAATPSRQALGLPGNGFVFCCFNQPYKILPDVFAVWMRLLLAVPGSVLWLLELNPWSAQNLRREAAAHGVDPSRLIFAPMV